MSKIYDLNSSRSDTVQKIILIYLKDILDNRPLIKFEETCINPDYEDLIKDDIEKFFTSKSSFNRICDDTLDACMKVLQDRDLIYKAFEALSGNAAVRFNLQKVTEFINSHQEIPSHTISDDKIYLSWEDFDAFIKKTIDHLNMTDKHYSGVFGLPRGGLIPAVVLSHKLHLPLLQAPAKDCIIVDDINDTGVTLQHYLLNDDYKIITWVFRESSAKKYHFNGLTINKQAGWVVFPWEDDRV